MDGYIKIYRSMFEHDLWKEKPFSRAQAWIDLLQLANIKDGKVWLKGSTVQVKRGQVFRSQDELANRWGWTRKAVRKFLGVLESEKMVTTKGTPIGTTITIEKYALYNDGGPTFGTTDGTTTGQRWANDGPDNKKERKKERKDNKESPSVWIEEIVPEELQEVFMGWADMRDRIKKPIATRETVARAWAKLQKISRNPDTQKAVVEQSIDRCWASFWELKDKPETKKYPEFEKVPEAPGVPMTEEQRKNQQKIIQELKKAF